MIQAYSLEELERAAPGEVADRLEDGNIVFFPKSPVPFPATDDLEFLKNDLPGFLRRKNIS